MLREVLFMGVREAMKLEPRKDTVIISILDQFEEHNRPDHLHKFKDHLILKFGHVREARGSGLAGSDVRGRAQGGV
jgi:hypothetical protein